MNETLWRLLATALFGRAPRRPAAPYVVSTTTETLALSWMVDSSLTYIRQVLSDGTVRMTELLETGSSLVGVGLGGHCSAAVDGHTLIEHGVLLSASVDAAGAAGRTWVFAGQRAADRWWQQRRNAVMTSALVRAVGGRALAEIGRAHV